MEIMEVEFIIRVGVDYNMNSKRLKTSIIIIGVIFISFLFIGVILYGTNEKNKEYEHLLKNAEANIEKENYEEAENDYIDAIEAKPKNEEAYIELANLYISQNEREGAKNILKDGIKEVNAKKRADIYVPLSKIEYAELVQESEEEHGTISYDEQVGMTGVCFLKEVDFNNDGINEFVMVYQSGKENEFEYTYEVWGYQGTDIEKLNSGELYGTDGGVKNLVFAENNGKIYLVTGWHDSEAYREYWGFEDGKFEIVRVAVVDGHSYYIDGKEVDREVWEKEESEWLQWERDETVFVFQKYMENDRLYEIVGKTKESLEIENVEENVDKDNQQETDDEIEEKYITEEEATQIVSQLIPEEDDDYYHYVELIGKTEHNSEECYAFVEKLIVKPPYDNAGEVLTVQNGAGGDFVYYVTVKGGNIMFE